MLQRSEASTRAKLTRLLEDGVIDMRGNGRARRCALSGAAYRAFEYPAGYVRVRAFDEPQHVQMILNYDDTHGSISRRETAELCGTSPETARRTPGRMREEHLLDLVGEPLVMWPRMGARQRERERRSLTRV